MTPVPTELPVIVSQPVCWLDTESGRYFILFALFLTLYLTVLVYALALYLGLAFFKVIPTQVLCQEARQKIPMYNRPAMPSSGGGFGRSRRLSGSLHSQTSSFTSN